MIAWLTRIAVYLALGFFAITFIAGKTVIVPFDHTVTLWAYALEQTVPPSPDERAAALGRSFNGNASFGSSR
ncbi:MAG: hypothetical protein AAFQ11_01430 [Pseudomonadota bacterium]